MLYIVTHDVSSFILYVRVLTDKRVRPGSVPPMAAQYGLLYDWCIIFDRDGWNVILVCAFGVCLVPLGSVNHTSVSAFLHFSKYDMFICQC